MGFFVAQPYHPLTPGQIVAELPDPERDRCTRDLEELQNTVGAKISALDPAGAS
jgi:hypothetical protein